MLICWRQLVVLKFSRVCLSSLHKHVIPVLIFQLFSEHLIHRSCSMSTLLPIFWLSLYFLEEDCYTFLLIFLDISFEWSLNIDTHWQSSQKEIKQEVRKVKWKYTKVKKTILDVLLDKNGWSLTKIYCSLKNKNSLDW